MRNTLCILSAYLLMCGQAVAQLQDKLFGMDDQGAGFYFASYDPGTSNVELIDPLPLFGYSNGRCMSVDVVNERFYISDITRVLELDPYGLVPPIITDLPLPMGAAFYHAAINPCDGHLYGMIEALPDSIVFARYDRQTNVFTTLAQLGLPQFFAAPPEGLIDVQNQRYVIYNYGRLRMFDLLSGELLVDVTLTGPPNEELGHIALKCGRRELYCTSWNLAANVKRVCEIDPDQGTATAISPALDQGVFKTLNSGSTIDGPNDVFYWPGVDRMMGVNTITGTVVHNALTAPYVFSFLQHFSPCACATTAVTSTEAEGSVPFSIGPNPFQDQLQVYAPGQEATQVSLRIVDPLGRLVMERDLVIPSGTPISTPGLEAGFYVYTARFRNARGARRYSGVLVKE